MIDGMDAALQQYISSRVYREALGLPEGTSEEYRLLAQGEYNRNYAFIHPVTGRELVLRVNHGSQMHLDHQIEYEANALRHIAASGRTPSVIFADGSEAAPGGGVLVMDKLPGHMLDYLKADELKGAAQCLADIHSIRIDPEETIAAAPDRIPPDADRLISPQGSMKAILSECEDMLAVYLASELPEPDKKKRLRALLDDAWKLVGEKKEPPYRCCINTELNSTNFLADRTDGVFVRLVDWEKPLYGDPAQDLSHFLAPTTTFWKTDVIFDGQTVDSFIDDYIKAAAGRFDTAGIRERTLAMIPVTCLRGMTWCAMAWVQYRTADKAIINESTDEKLGQYLDDSFISMIEDRIREALKGIK